MTLSRREIRLRILALVIVALLVVAFAWYQGWASDHRGGDKETSETPISTEAFHITKADGVKSIAQLIREQSKGAPTPDLSISAIHFYVDPFNGDLIFPRVEDFQPEGFGWGVLAGQDKRILTTKVALRGIQALEFFPVKTDTVCNFLIVLEFYPKR